MADSSSNGAAISRELFPNIHHAQKRALLTLYMESGRLAASCRQLGMDHKNHYYWMKTDQSYVAAFAEAQRYAALALEEAAIARATAQERPSDVLLIFLLKGLLPEKYRDTARRDTANDISELLKAVLLEMHAHAQPKDVTPDVTWAPRPPSRTPLPPPPDEER